MCCSSQRILLSIGVVLCDSATVEVPLLNCGRGADAGDGREYTSRVQTRHGYATVRVPFNSFRAVEPGVPPLDPAHAARLSVRYEPRSRVAATIIGQEDSVAQCAARLDTMLRLFSFERACLMTCARV